MGGEGWEFCTAIKQQTQYSDKYNISGESLNCQIRQNKQDRTRQDKHEETLDGLDPQDLPKSIRITPPTQRDPCRRRP